MVKTSTQDYADSSNNLDIKICQDQKCCNTDTLTGKLDKGSEKYFFPENFGECHEFEINSNEDIDVTFNQVSTDGWRGELVKIVFNKELDYYFYGCPITTWLDVNSQEDDGENNPSSFETVCKVTFQKTYEM